MAPNRSTDQTSLIQRAVLLTLGTVIGGVLAIRLFSGGGSPESNAPNDNVQDSGAALSFADRVALAQKSGDNEIRIADLAITDKSLESLAESNDWLETLIVDEGIVTDAGTALIAQLPNLSHLRLRHSPITDTGIEKLAGCRAMMILNLPHAQCTNEGIRHLQSLPQLRNLRLGSSELDAKTAAAVAELTTLESVHLIGVPVDDEGVKLLAAMPNLHSLYLDDSNVSEAGWDWLFENHADLHIHINQKHHDRDPNHKHDHP